MTKRQLAGSRILITGGGSGLGRQMGVQAARRGAHIIIWDRDRDAAEREVLPGNVGFGEQCRFEAFDAGAKLLGKQSAPVKQMNLINVSNAD